MNDLRAAQQDYRVIVSASTLGGISPDMRGALAKDAGVPPEGTGSHRIAIGGDAGSFTDPDGFDREAAAGITPRDGGLSRLVRRRRAAGARG